MNFRKTPFFIGLLSLSVGILFYVCLRGYVIAPHLRLSETMSHNMLTDVLPSFLHTYGMVLITIAFGSSSILASIMWMSINLLLELGQHLFSIGTFDWFDVMATIVVAYPDS
jgi:hypothetical protein